MSSSHFYYFKKYKYIFFSNMNFLWSYDLWPPSSSLVRAVVSVEMEASIIVSILSNFFFNEHFNQGFDFIML